MTGRAVVVDFGGVQATVDTDTGRIGWLSDWDFLWSALLPRQLVVRRFYGPDTYGHTDYLWLNQTDLAAWRAHAAGLGHDDPIPTVVHPVSPETKEFTA